MMRNDQNSGHTVGTVSQAALLDLLGRRLPRIVDVALEQQA